MPIVIEGVGRYGLHNAIRWTLSGAGISTGHEVAKRIKCYQEHSRPGSAKAPDIYDHRLAATAAADLAHNCIFSLAEDRESPQLPGVKAFETVFNLFDGSTAPLIAGVLYDELRHGYGYFGIPEHLGLPQELFCNRLRDTGRNSAVESCGISIGSGIEAAGRLQPFTEYVYQFRAYTIDAALWMRDSEDRGVGSRRIFKELITGNFGIVRLLNDRFKNSGNTKMGYQFLKAVAPLVFDRHLVELPWMQELMQKARE